MRAAGFASIADQGAAALILLTGLAHIAAASAAFTTPSQRAVWFLSAGLLGITAGLANLARARARPPSRLLALAALSGSLAMVLIGALLAAVDPGMLTSGPAVLVFAVGALSAAFGAADLFRRA